MRRIITFALWGAAATAAQASDLSKAYAVAFVGSYFAEQNCHGLKQDATALIRLRYGAVRNETEEREAEAEMTRLKPIVQKAMLEQGTKAWCASAWSLFGPDGLDVVLRD